MIQSRYFADTGPGGQTLADRLRAVGYIPVGAGYVVAENIASGTLQLGTPAAIVAAWMASPPHRANILDPQLVETAVAIAPGTPLTTEAPGATYTQDFGAIIHSGRRPEGHSR